MKHYPGQYNRAAHTLPVEKEKQKEMTLYPGHVNKNSAPPAGGALPKYQVKLTVISLSTLQQ